jgi:hypothetical protein
MPIKELRGVARRERVVVSTRMAGTKGPKNQYFKWQCMIFCVLQIWSYRVKKKFNKWKFIISVLQPLCSYATGAKQTNHTTAAASSVMLWWPIQKEKRLGMWLRDTSNTHKILAKKLLVHSPLSPTTRGWEGIITVDVGVRMVLALIHVKWWSSIPAALNFCF